MEDLYLGKIVFPNVRSTMFERKLSIRNLARKMGMVHTTLMRKLYGIFPFYFDEVEKMTEALGLDRSRIYWLMTK